jgi:hypothetical protein
VTTLTDLEALVASRYEEQDLPGWPNPHQGSAPPRDDEYSRVTNPERYRIVHARARVWASVLEDELGISPEVLDPTSGSGGGPTTFDRGVRLSRGKSGALALLLLERDVHAQPGEPPLAALDIAVSRPDVVVDRWPDCGCDACDDGSAALLRAIDETIVHIIGGSYVVLRGEGWHAEWHPGGGSAGTAGRRAPDFQSLMEMCRRLSRGDPVRLPRNSEALVGRAWID